MKCRICNYSVKSKYVLVRSGKKKELFECEKCELQFFDYNPDTSLNNDNLDKTRLKSAGLEIPKIDEDFKNGTLQSKKYLEEYIDKQCVDQNILEIGCSWGYFLNLLKEYGAIPYGVEINEKRKSYVNKELFIKCESDLKDYKKLDIKFHKIFYFMLLNIFIIL